MFTFTGLPDSRCNICHKDIGHTDKECHMTVKGFTYVLCEDCYEKYKGAPDALLEEVENRLNKNKKKIDKRFIPPKTIRPATAEERELYMKYCDTANEKQEVYISEGEITDIYHKGVSMTKPEGSGMGEAADVMHTASTMVGITNTKVYEFQVDFQNGYKNLIDALCVLYTRNKGMEIEVKPNTPCKICWIKKKGLLEEKYELRYVLPEGVTHNTPITQCRWCSKMVRVEDIGEDGCCIYCQKPIKATLKDFIKESFNSEK